LGEGSWDKGSTQLMKVVYKEFPFYTNGVTSWVDVADVVKASVMLMESDVEAERFIISAGNYGYREIFTHMAKALDKKPPRYYAGPLVSGIVWRINSVQSTLTGKRPVVTRETASSAHGHSIYSNRKFVEIFPSFAYTTIEETIERMARSFIKSL
jgi:nucleoside-diphosphate-sugar epimerase